LQAEKYIGLSDNHIPKGCLFLVGNKTDLDEKRELSTEEGQQLAQKVHAHFLETSALDNSNVNEVFTTLCQKIIQKIERNEIQVETP